MPHKSPFPLYAQVVLAVLCGATLGGIFGQEPYLNGLRNEQLGKVGLWVVWVLKALAVPLIFFAIVDSLIRATVPLRQGAMLIAICLVNVSVAMVIGLTIIVSGLLTAFGTIGVDVSALVAGVGITTFAVAFALQDIIGNLLSGILILMYRPFRRGHYIRVGALEGIVTDIVLRFNQAIREHLARSDFGRQVGIRRIQR